MRRTFKSFVENREQEDQKLRNMFLQRLGFEPRAMDDSTIKIRDLSKDKLQQAVAKIGLDPDSVQKIQNWIDNNPDTTLQNLISQVMGGQQDDFGQTDIPSAPAELPLGQPKPERRPVPPMYGGPPPNDGKLT